jgi:CAAX prenyl protease-like protein
VPTNSEVQSWREEYPAVGYVAPFALFLAFLALGPKVPLDPEVEGPVRVLTMAVVCAIFWPREISIRPARLLTSISIGIGAFLLWIAPDRLIPGYREYALFSNGITGHLHSSLSAASLQSTSVLAWRTARAVIIVPIVEELFWRGWLMRWLVDTDFRKVPLGTYTPLAFWVTAILFASEHGPYWDVGLITGIIYNLWMIRSKSIADCILMHAVTNAILSAYVIATGQWQYWQ